MSSLGSFDFTSAKIVEGGNYIKPGEYTVKITKAESKQASTGTPQVLLTLENSQSEEINHYVNLNMSNDFTRDLLATFLAVLGMDVLGKNVELTEELFVGKSFNGTFDWVQNQTDGKWYNRLKHFDKYAGEVIYNPSGVEKPKNTPIAGGGFGNYGAPNDPGAVQDFSINDDDLPF